LIDPVRLPFSGPPVLACGAWLKNTVCVTRDDQAFVSQLIGDLDSADAMRMLDKTVESLCELMPPVIVAHDLHPDFYSSRFAMRYAAAHHLPTLAVQHHHAHIAAICAEHRFRGTVLGLALDGVGLGDDGTAWGGELLKVDGAHFQRLGHLAHIAMPGGDRAAHEPWRMAAAVLFELGRGDEIAQRFCGQPAAAMVAEMLKRGLNCPVTSSMGRLFDAAAGLLGVNEIQTVEAEAAILLQTLAHDYGIISPMRGGYSITVTGVLDFSPLLSHLADCQDAAFGAALFHATIAAGLLEWVVGCGVQTVALGGGCFYNDILLHELSGRLRAHGLQVLTSVSPGDSSISLGQGWIALQSLRTK